MSIIAEPTPAQKAVLDRMLWRVMPLVTACMVICTIDRSNVGFAKLTMTHDLMMSEAVFALGSSLYFVSYVAFEIPGALGTHLFGARIWFARIMFTWGLATLALAFTNPPRCSTCCGFCSASRRQGFILAFCFTSRFGFRDHTSRER
ncbi:MAG: hypothetical protein WDN76_03315 [Alphaproteobacteria bacterium]